MTSNLRLGLVPYANVLPLMEGLESRFPQENWLRATPRELAGLLAQGAIDAATLPIFEALRTPGYRLVPGCAIASDGPVRSVALFSVKPLRDVRSILLDRSSLTSVNLARILCAEHLRIEPYYELSAAPIPSAFDLHASGHDAAVVIGDNALAWERRGFPHVLDFGTAWKALTGLPFVYAAWIVRPGVELAPEDLRAFVEARRNGEQDVYAIARRETSDPAALMDLVEYLSRSIHYRLGPEHLRAIDLFRRKLIHHGLIPSDTAPLPSIPVPAGISVED
ncbi:MAG: chorismate dehydratase [Candidatus Sumerlaeota bacterium]|nr:chorismate dehydratase [Candidatus Sumerlaeota bacterium]